MNRRHFITNDLSVWGQYARSIEDNGMPGDARQVLQTAPAFGKDEEYVFVRTNGDPILVGWRGLSGDFEIAEDAREWLEEQKQKWIRDELECL